MVTHCIHVCHSITVAYPNLNMSVNRMLDLCCHAPFGHVAASDRYLFTNYAIGVLTERQNKRMSISLTC